MPSYATLQGRPEALKVLTRVSREEFEDLYKRFLSAWEEAG